MRLSSQNQAKFSMNVLAPKNEWTVKCWFGVLYFISNVGSKICCWYLLCMFVCVCICDCVIRIFNVCLASNEQRELNIAKVCLNSSIVYAITTFKHITIQDTGKHYRCSYRWKAHNSRVVHYYQHSDNDHISKCKHSETRLEGKTSFQFSIVPPVFYNNQRDYIKLFEPFAVAFASKRK